MVKRIWNKDKKTLSHKSNFYTLFANELFPQISMFKL